MEANLHPLDSAAQAKIRGLLTSDLFSKWVDCIRSELDYEIVKSNSEFIDSVLDPSVVQSPRDLFVRAARLRVALAVIEEFASIEKQHATLHLRS